MNIRLIEYNSKDHDDMIKLRNNILRIPLGLHFSIDEKKVEKDCFLIGAFEKTAIIGCCLLSKINSTTLQLRQMAVSKEFQGKGIGYAIVQYAETIAKKHNYVTLLMHARSTAVGFYQKLGYSIGGNEFMEIGIPHYLMQKIFSS